MVDGTPVQPKASGKVVLVAGALVGALFILAMYLGVLYDRATDPPHAAGPNGSAEVAP
jgi:hypothetical protein